MSTQNRSKEPIEYVDYAQALTPEEVAARKYQNYGRSTWGPWLFTGVVAASLVFMWWLTIYSHGVAPHH